jgi:hypothetical protein
MNLSKVILFIYFSIFYACTTQVKEKVFSNQILTENVESDYFTKVHKTQCIPGGKIISYTAGDLPCIKNEVTISSKVKMRTHYKIVNKDTEDLYERGYQVLMRYKNGKVVEEVKLRRNGEPHWSEVPFVRIRKQKYLADLDGDGFLEFAIFPFSSGSAIWGTVRIFSLKNKIEYWGEGRYQFEGDTFVQLGCMSCSKFNPDECGKCR